MRRASVALRVLSLRASLTLALPVVAAAQDRAADEAAIRAHTAAYQAGVNTQDPEAIANLYTANGDLVFMDEARIAGRAALLQHLRRQMANRPPTLRITLAVTDIQWVAPDLAIVETRATFNEGAIRSNRGTSVLIKRDGRWLMRSLRVYADDKAAALGIASSAAAAQQGRPASVLDGVWDYLPPLRGQGLYRDGQYVLFFTRPDSAPPAGAMDEGAQARLFRTMGLQAGSFTISDTIVTMHQHHAKDPRVPPRTWRWSYTLMGDTLAWRVLNAQGQVTARGRSVRLAPAPR